MEIIKRITRDANGIKYEVLVDNEKVWERYVAFGGNRRRSFIEAMREQDGKASNYINPLINKLPL